MPFALAIAVFAVASYLLGGVNGALLFSSLLHHEDIRKKGSGNPGFTNYKRVYGLRWDAVCVMLFDILKTVVPIVGTAAYFSAMHGMWQFGTALAGLSCMLGHCFPVWYGFRGGKAFIAGITTVFFVDWRAGLIALGVFLLVLFTLHIMSVASCSALLVGPVAIALFGPADPALAIILLSAAAGALVIARHYKNFVKLAHGEESKFYFFHKKQTAKAEEEEETKVEV